MSNFVDWSLSYEANSCLSTQEATTGHNSEQHESSQLPPVLFL
jgi:hypothetical protein